MTTCKREVAALLANVHISSNGLTELEDPACVGSTDEASCAFKSGSLDTPPDAFYYARGPLGLQGDQQYADFSRLFYEGYNRS